MIKSVRVQDGCGCFAIPLWRYSRSESNLFENSLREVGQENQSISTVVARLRLVIMRWKFSDRLAGVRLMRGSGLGLKHAGLSGGNVRTDRSCLKHRGRYFERNMDF